MLELSKIRQAVQYEGGVSRRLFLAYTASLSALPLVGRRASAAKRRMCFKSNPFTLGVASGDPDDRGMVLWTRLAPRPLDPDYGMGNENVNVSWEIASDDRMCNVVSRGNAVATPELGHSVHVEVNNLKPDRWYWYRFRAGDAESVIGRTRTMPRSGATPDELRFAFASCQHLETGHYTAYEHMAREKLDLVFHLGDYIYEDAGEEGRVRRHLGGVLESLDDYRIRHSQYKGDKALQAMHARCPWIVTWDDHEFTNDCAGDFCRDEKVDPAKYLMRRANAYQAYYEMMPLRATSLPSGPRMRLYRPASFGQLAEFFVLDTRQYRTPQPYEGDRHDIDDLVMSPDGTMIGAEQMDWLQSSLTKSNAKWNVLAQQVLMAMVDAEPGEEQEFSMEKWAGYSYERIKLMQYLEEQKIANPVVITGDIHSNWVNDLRVDDRKADTQIVATEFVGTSISSSGDGEDRMKVMEKSISENPCVRFFNAQRGYVTCKVTPKMWQTDFRIVPKVTTAGAPIFTRASFVVEADKPGAVEA
jgi:alkaline phosphatase D